MQIEFKVGDRVRAVDAREVGAIVRIAPGKATRRLVHTVRYTESRSNPGYGFYYENEIVKVEE